MAKRTGFTLEGRVVRAAAKKKVELTKGGRLKCQCDCHKGKVNPHTGSKCLCKKRCECECHISKNQAIKNYSHEGSICKCKVATQ